MKQCSIFLLAKASVFNRELDFFPCTTFPTSGEIEVTLLQVEI